MKKKYMILAVLLIVSLIPFAGASTSGVNLSLAIVSGDLIANQSFQMIDNAVECQKIGLNQYNNNAYFFYTTLDRFPSVGTFSVETGSLISDTTLTTVPSISSPAYQWAGQLAYCDHADALGNKFVASIYHYYNNSIYAIPTADFIGSPTSGNFPQLITLTSTSSSGATSWNWSGTGSGSMLWGNKTTRNSSVYLPSEGNYTITHCAANSAGSDCETKTNYITLTNAANTTITTQFIAIDAVSGYSISNASISLKDIQNNSWTNTTSTTSMGKAYITTLNGHTINAYATAAGFKDNDLLGVPAIAAPGGHIIMMNPTGYYNVSPGWITLHVKVQDESTSNPISGASVSVGKSNGMAELWQTTNAAGIATFPVENQTDFVVRASASGYTAASKGVSSGNGNGGDATVPVNIFLSKATVTPAVTMTAGPGGTVPVTQDPYLSLSPEEKQSALATNVMNYGPMLVNFFILLTIVGGFKMITK